MVPVNPAFKQDELDFYFRQCAVRAVISDERSAGVCERIVAGWERPAQVITTSSAHGQALTLDMLMEHEPAKLEPRSPDEALVYQFSSGSTGRPKRVARTHGQCSGEAGYYPGAGHRARATASSARSRSSTRTGWAAACSPPPPPAPRS